MIAQTSKGGGSIIVATLLGMKTSSYDTFLGKLMFVWYSEEAQQYLVVRMLISVWEQCLWTVFISYTEGYIGMLLSEVLSQLTPPANSYISGVCILEPKHSLTPDTLW